MSIDQQIEQFIEAQRGRRAGSVPLRQCREVRYLVVFYNERNEVVNDFDIKIGPDDDIIRNWGA